MKRCFLLGGRDLEMLTIKQLLTENNELFYDRSLAWSNALLSEYERMLCDEDCEYFGIELREDCPTPHHYSRIDHHNDYSYKASSLEQVAQILDVTLNRWQQLVAANDSRYIPGMNALNASAKEIAEVRKADRRAQGVTEDDERLAEESIQDLNENNDLIVVYAKCRFFSPIVDRLYPYKKLVIYNDKELTYYGEGVDRIIGMFQQELELGKAYFGGGKNGFWGISKGAYPKERIEEIKELIIKLQNEI